jgi:nucleoside-diphosphate-sugar epimerase
VHVADLVDGLRRLAERGRRGEEYILAGTPHTLEHFYSLVARLCGLPDARIVSSRLMRALALVHDFVPGGRQLFGGLPLSREEVTMALDCNFAFSSEKARRELGWSARPVESGLPATLAWLRADHSGAGSGPYGG